MDSYPLREENSSLEDISFNAAVEDAVLSSARSISLGLTDEDLATCNNSPIRIPIPH